MESKLSVGDRIIISKLSYGPKKPNSIEDIPFGGLFRNFSSNKKKRNYSRMSGISMIQRHDIVVYQSQYNTNYVKRIIGLPGDTLSIIDSRVYINNDKLNELSTYKFYYRLKIDTLNLKLFNFSNSEFSTLEDKNKYERDIYGTNEKVVSIYPKDKIFEWNMDNYGEVIIPKKNQIIYLNVENIQTYKKYIEVETGKIISSQKGKIHLNDSVIDKYLFNMNYYFMMGDNRHHSSDSRSKGFISEDQIEGKLSFTF